MSSDIPLIRTKIIIPRRRSEIISRARLLTILDNVLDLKLLIVAAPAGYGKTSLLVDYYRHLRAPMCWYALDPLDIDLKRFLAHFIASITERFPEFGEQSRAALADLHQDDLNLDPVISAIVNDAFEHVDEHFIFVLDDYHLVRDSKPIELFMNRIIQEATENFHFIIASRTLLTFPDLSLLVARSQVDGLSFEELAFLPEEIKQLMAVNYHQTINDTRAEEMLSLTEGWITGLLLTAQLSPRGTVEKSRVEKVSGVGIYEYLTQQVFDRQTVAMQSFLLRTSLLEEFDASLCETIISRSLDLIGQDWDDVIQRIQRDNLFVLPVGDEGALFLRYHHLFRDFLQNRMRLERPEETLKIETALAEHYQQTQEWERAITIYQRMGAYDRVEDLIRKAAPSMILSGRLITLSEWLDSLPNDAADTKPELLSIRGSIAILRGDTKASIDLLNKAIEGLRRNSNVEDLAEALIRRSAVNRHFGYFETALKDALEGLELSKPPFGSPARYAEALRSEGLVYFHTGDLTDAQWKLRESYRRFTDLGLDTDAAKVLMELGVVYRAQGDLEQTERCYMDSLGYWQSTRNSLWQANVLNNIGVMQHLAGKYEQAVVTLEKALSYARLAVNPRLEAFTLTSLGDLYKELRASLEASQAYQQALAILDRTNDFELEVYVSLAVAELERFSGDYTAAATRLGKLSENVEQAGVQYTYQLVELENQILKFRTKFDPALEAKFRELEEYFISAGYQSESLKASFYKVLTGILVSKTRSPAQLETLLTVNLTPTKHQHLLRMCLEHAQVISELEVDADQTPGLHQLIQELADFQRELPQLHKMVRRFSSAVQFAIPKITIRSFGKMQVRFGSKVITGKEWKTQVVRDLFFFLLTQPEGVTKEEIGEVFWQEADQDTIKLRFKNTLYRLRRAIGKEVVIYTDDDYQFNKSIDYEYDADLFNQGIHLAENAHETDEKIAHYAAAVAVYKGTFLPKLDYDWVLTHRASYQRLFLDACSSLTDLYIKKGLYQEAVKVTQRALEEDLINESIYRSSMLAYSAMNDRPAVIRVYEQCRNVLQKELEIEPSPQTVSLFNSLIHR